MLKKAKKGMQDYIDLAKKNGVDLKEIGACQFCGAKLKRGIHECLEIFNLGFQGKIFTKTENQIFRFLIVDAHALQHPEIHGRWSNHFHLLRLHLIFNFNIDWTYSHSPKLSMYLNEYKANRQDEYLIPPQVLERGSITSADLINISTNEERCKDLIRQWAVDVYKQWQEQLIIVDRIAKAFLYMN